MDDLVLPGLFCLESEWSDEFDQRPSVEPLLRLFVDHRVAAGVVHRDVATLQDFFHRLDGWLERDGGAYPVVYLAFHGSRGSLHIGSDCVTLDELAGSLAGRLSGRVLYFGSCLTMKTPTEELETFCRRTGARGVIGYTTAVDWFESAAFDLFLLPRLLRARYIAPLFTSPSKERPELVTALGLRIATQDWCSE